MYMRTVRKGKVVLDGEYYAVGGKVKDGVKVRVVPSRKGLAMFRDGVFIGTAKHGGQNE